MAKKVVLKVNNMGENTPEKDSILKSVADAISNALGGPTEVPVIFEEMKPAPAVVEKTELVKMASSLPWYNKLAPATQEFMQNIPLNNNENTNGFFGETNGVLTCHGYNIDAATEFSTSDGPVVADALQCFKNVYGDIINRLIDECFTALPELLINENGEIQNEDELAPYGFLSNNIVMYRNSTKNILNSFDGIKLTQYDQDSFTSLLLSNFNARTSELITDMLKTIAHGYNCIVGKHINSEEIRNWIDRSRSIYSCMDTNSQLQNPIPFLVNFYPINLPVLDYICKLSSHGFIYRNKRIGVSENTMVGYVMTIHNYCETTAMRTIKNFLESVLLQNPGMYSMVYSAICSDVAFLRGEFIRFITSTLLEIEKHAFIFYKFFQQHTNMLNVPEEKVLIDPPWKIVIDPDHFNSNF